MRRSLSLAAATLAIALGGCGGNEERGGLSAEEEKQLDNAAAMLDDNSMLAVPDDSLVANEAELDAMDGAAASPANEVGNGQ